MVPEERVPIFSFTFGVPNEARLSALKEAGIPCRTPTPEISGRAKEDRIELMSLWAGQAARLGRAVPAVEVVESVVRPPACRRREVLTAVYVSSGPT